MQAADRAFHPTVASIQVVGWLRGQRGWSLHFVYQPFQQLAQAGGINGRDNLNVLLLEQGSNVQAVHLSGLLIAAVLLLSVCVTSRSAGLCQQSG